MDSDYSSFEQWQQLMRCFNFSDNEVCYQLLIEAHHEKQRYYHDISHLNAVLSHLSKVEHLTDSPCDIALALWFHDAIYKPFSSSNEKNSAVWCQRFLLKNNAQQELINKIFSLIMATLHHTEPTSRDEQLMVDIDLSILGCSAEHYRKFEEQVRKEYRFVPNFLYKKKRKAILQGFLSRQSIYHHEYFYDRFEKQARENITNAIATL